MQDDDKQQPYERLDETSPERNKRSFFDWLRGKEETEEERLRKKLDEELKEAARQRATDFEEERRVEEKREVTETKKLKKRWRAKLVEKSKKLLSETSERGDEPASGYEIAKLMVAERIVKLHKMLHDDTLDLRRSEVKGLKINIDFMGLLSEKLDRPELEVPKEVEELYETIAESVEETTGEQPPETSDEQPEIPPISDEDAAYTEFANSIVHAIRRVMQNQQPTEPTSSSTGSEQQPIAPSNTTVATQKTAETIATSTAPLNEKLLSVVKRTALSTEAIREEVSHAEQARKLAYVVERAAMFDRHVATRPEKPEPQTPVASEKGTPNDEKLGFNLAPNQKIKYLSEPGLLQLATQVEVGGGRLLSDVYKRGEIDREGLIKVLESYNKHQDYRSVLLLRRNRRPQQRHESPEYLPQPTPSSDPPTVVSGQSPLKTPEKDAIYSKTVGKQVLSMPLPPSESRPNRQVARVKEALKNSKAEATRFVRDVQERLKREKQIAVLVTTLFILVVLFVAILELNTR